VSRILKIKLQLVTVLVAMLTLQGCVTGVVLGTVGAAMVANDRRTAPAQLEDETIELKANKLIRDTVSLDNHTNITVISYNRTMLMIGQAPNAMLKDQAVKLMQQVPNVTRLHNQIRIATPTSLTTRTHDTWLTTKIKASMANDNSFAYSHVKVITENSEVFLLGLVSQKEADKATEITRNIDGVSKVTKVFEYQ
jgi:osmotically-inducible protein OsmY